jgi:hypothetical protein
MSFASRLRRLSNSFKVGERPERYHVPARVTLGTRFPNHYGGTGKLTINEGGYFLEQTDLLTLR